MTTGTGTEVIDLIERFNFNLGRVVECIARADTQPESGVLAELEQAQWHLQREVDRIRQSFTVGEESPIALPARPASPVDRLGSHQQDGTLWEDRMGDRYRFRGVAWEYVTRGQTTWEAVKFEEILTDFGPYTLIDAGRMD
ncbi:hypothetical protein ACRCUN_07740 [Mycobacterium sp. LTG2003]